MKRRDFLQSGAAITALTGAGLIASQTETAAAASSLHGSEGMIQSGMLRGRNQNRSTTVALHGVAASSQTVASGVGLEILRKGGSAIDAAIAVNAMLALVEPMSCGPGGDLFAIAWSEKDQKLFGLNASGRSPYAYSLQKAAELGYDDQLPIYGPHTWSVPGCVSGWGALHKKFGKLKFAELLEPAAQYAREGFAVTEIIAGYWRNAGDHFQDYANALSTYTVGGKEPLFGQVFSNPDFASFLEILMRDGADAYYHGEIADRIVKYSQERGGLFTKKDFEDHTADWVEPVSSNYRGYDVYEIPPNGQGIAALQILNMLEGFDIASLTPNSAGHLHLFIEAKKLAFEDRSVYYADPAKADVPIDWLISKEYGKERAKLIDPKKASVEIKPGALDGSKDTVYLCASDDEGNMVSFIQSIYYGWGSREVPAGLGFCLQNRGRSFNLDPKHNNRLEPHKRPFHTIIPGFVMKDGAPKCAFGVMGGDFQPQGHAQVLMNMIDFGMSMQQAGEQPRAEHNGSSQPWGDKIEAGGTVGLEAGISDETAAQLETMGHKITSRDTGMYGGYQSIWREDSPRRYFAGSDPRKDGCAVGY